MTQFRTSGQSVCGGAHTAWKSHTINVYSKRKDKTTGFLLCIGPTAGHRNSNTGHCFGEKVTKSNTSHCFGEKVTKSKTEHCSGVWRESYQIENRTLFWSLERKLPNRKLDTVLEYGEKVTKSKTTLVSILCLQPNNDGNPWIERVTNLQLLARTTC